ncbi:MAG: hypothetical protein WAN81_17520, partial [Candidatus Binataceae bacterium]
ELWTLSRAEKMMEAKKTLTTGSGAPVTDNQNSRTAGPGGPVLILTTSRKCSAWLQPQATFP